MIKQGLCLTHWLTACNPEGRFLAISFRLQTNLIVCVLSQKLCPLQSVVGCLKKEDLVGHREDKQMMLRAETCWLPLRLLWLSDLCISD